MNKFGQKDQIDAVAAKSNAQKIAFAPIVFQATLALRNLGILDALMRERKTGMTATAIADELGLSVYGVKVLLEGGMGAEVVYLEDDRYYLTKTGYFILTDKLTEVNMNFVADVCYKPMAHLQQSIVDGKPAGLKELGPWDTVYEGLSQLPEPISDSWFAFDHFYSDVAFPLTLPIVFSREVKHLVDVGGNTGKWAKKCLEHDPSVRITLLDLPGQLNKAEKNLSAAGFDGRFETMPTDLLAESDEFPTDCDVIWMSQFLDCFSEDEIVRILKRARNGMDANTSLFILETYWDTQQFEASAFSLVNTSLYFTCVANGNSKMYHSDEMKKCATEAGLQLHAQTDDIGIGHTLLEYKLAT